MRISNTPITVFINTFIHSFLQVKEKKYETVGTTSQMLAASMRIMAASSVSLQPFRNPIRSSSIMSSLAKKSPPPSSETSSKMQTNGGQKLVSNVITGKIS